MRTLVAVVVLAVAPLSACQGSPSGGGRDAHRLEVRGAHTAFSVDVPEDWAITDVWDADTCGSGSYRIGVATETRLVVETVPTQCAEAEQNSEIGNGRHGTYRTIEDVPEPRDETTVETGLGTATAFIQTYYECTNSCHNWNEPVAIVTLDAPVDDAYPTLVVRGEKENVSRAELEKIVASLTAPS